MIMISNTTSIPKSTTTSGNTTESTTSTRRMLCSEQNVVSDGNNKNTNNTNDCTTSKINNNKYDNDGDNPLQNTIDTIKTMIHQEQTRYCLRSLSSSHIILSSIDSIWRQRIIEWMYSVIDHYSLCRDSVAVATYYLDRVTIRGIITVITNRRDYQLCAITSLLLAIKLYDNSNRMISIRSMIKLGRGLFVEKDIVQMESTILSTLQWYVHPPTSVCYLRQYIQLLVSNNNNINNNNNNNIDKIIISLPQIRYMIMEVTRFIIELSICLYPFVQYKSYEITYAAMILTTDTIYEQQYISQYERYEIERIFDSKLQLKRDHSTIQSIIYQLQQSIQKNTTNIHDLITTIYEQYPTTSLSSSSSSVSLLSSTSSSSKSSSLLSSSKVMVVSPQYGDSSSNSNNNNNNNRSSISTTTTTTTNNNNNKNNDTNTNTSTKSILPSTNTTNNDDDNNSNKSNGVVIGEITLTTATATITNNTTTTIQQQSKPPSKQTVVVSKTIQSPCDVIIV